MMRKVIKLSFHKLNLQKISPFCFCSILIGFGLLAFHFWMAYPGFMNWDSRLFMLSRDNIQPIMMYYLFSAIFHLFGYHVWYGLLLILAPFYLGLWLVVFGFYRRYKSWWALLCFFPMFIQTIFISLFFILSVSFEASYSFLLYACLMYITLVPSEKRRTWIIFCIALSITISLFARHNGIVQIFPAVALGVYFILNEKSKLKFLLKYTSLTFLGLILLIGFKIIVDKAVSSQDLRKPHQHIFVHQLAAMCVPENDASCFDKSWFLPGRNFEDIKRVYQQHPFNGDYFGWYENDCGIYTNKIVAKGIEKKWLQSVFKYPENYLKHEIAMIKLLWMTPIQFIEYAPIGPKSPFYETFNFYEEDWRVNNTREFPKAESYMHETPIKKRLLHIWDDYLPKINTMFWIYYMLLTGIISTVLLFFKQRSKALIYCFHLSWGGMLAAIVYGMFYPNLFWRYIELVWVFGIGNTFALLSYIFDMIISYKANRRANSCI